MSFVRPLFALFNRFVLLACALFVVCPALSDEPPPQPQQQILNNPQAPLNNTSIPNNTNTQNTPAPLGDSKMAVANQAAAEVLRSRMQDERPRDFELLSSVEKADVIVIHGSMDRVQDVLSAVGVPHLLIQPHELDQIDLNARQLVMVNCPGNMTPTAVEKLRKFVNAGGFLYTTDWALVNVLQIGFPGFVEYNGTPTQNDVVEVQILEKDSNFLTHLKLGGEDPKWWLEGSSYPIRIVNRKAVQVLVGSTEMGKKYGDTPIAITFPYGDGRVLHIASHFYLQQNELRSERDKVAGSTFIQDSALPAASVQKLKDSDTLKDVSAGDLQSAYSTQQMTTNLVVERKKDQARVDGLYQNTTTEEVTINGKKAPKGEKLNVLETKGDKTRVRTMSGDEDWLDSAVVK